MNMAGTQEPSWLIRLSLMFSVEHQIFIKSKRLCHHDRAAEISKNESKTMQVIRLVLRWLEVHAKKMVKIRHDGSYVVVSFPHCGGVFDDMVWHGTSLQAAFSIFHRGFRIGDYGHRKSSGRRHVNGIWVTKNPVHSLSRAATSKGWQPLCSQCKDGDFDAWSTPVVIALLTHLREETTCRGTQAGVLCIENMDEVSLNEQGLTCRVLHRIRFIQFQLDTYLLYRNVLGDVNVREAIKAGVLVMCSARCCWVGMTTEQLAHALVCPNRNPCGNVIEWSIALSCGWYKTKAGRWVCPRCNPHV